MPVSTTSQSIAEHDGMKSNEHHLNPS